VTKRSEDARDREAGDGPGRDRTPGEPIGSGGASPVPLAPEPIGGEEIDPITAELERLRAREDELLRALAEQQNVLRRRKQEMESSVRYAQESLVRDLLPVLDDFERALGAMEKKADDSIRSGVALVHEHLVKILERQGLQAIRPRGGDPFDPELHDALAQRPDAGTPAGTVLDVAQPGYRLQDRVLRHAKVVVAGPADTGEAAPVAGGNAP
jgi:molecular chaperone GrpE